ncbi:MAG TPA: hypothetical protein VLZ77_04170 [Acidimicrobiales bacterium]|nr:hypothetical protein [Acidimicrobiales bacterium]
MSEVVGAFADYPADLGERRRTGGSGAHDANMGRRRAGGAGGWAR